MYFSRCIALCLALSVLIVSPLTAQETDDKAKAQKTREMKAGDLTLVIPGNWKAKPSRSSMRLATLEIPAAKGDKESGELTVFRFVGQDIDANLVRWVGQFQSSGRKQVVKKGKTKSSPYYLANISGTYKKPDGPPVLQRTIDAPGYRMLGVILPVQGKGVYFLKLAGPDKTVAAQLKALRKSFGGDEKSEKEYSF